MGGCISFIVSNILYFGEKFSLWMSFTALTMCIIFTIIITLMLGIGLGYNYCFVDYKSRAKYRYVPPHYARYGTPQPNWREELESYPIKGYIRTDNEITEKPLNASEQEVSKLLDKLGYPLEMLSANEVEKDKAEDAALLKTKVEPFGTDDITETVPAKTATPVFHLKLKFRTNEMLTDTTYSSKSDATTTTTVATAAVTSATITAASEEKPETPVKTMISISGLDLIALLSQLRAENRNYSIQIVTT